MPKKNGKSRLVVNYRPLNAITQRDEYPIPDVSDILESLNGQKIFSTLDATEGFHQIQVHQGDRQYTAFNSPFGLFQYTRVPFGMTNSPAMFQRAINEVFSRGLYRKCCAYIDDIIVFGRTQEEHDANLDWVLQQCLESNLKINPAKCEFSETEITFLGRKITH